MVVLLMACDTSLVDLRQEMDTSIRSLLTILELILLLEIPLMIGIPVLADLTATYSVVVDNTGNYTVLDILHNHMFHLLCYHCCHTFDQQHS